MEKKWSMAYGTETNLPVDRMKPKPNDDSYANALPGIYSIGLNGSVFGYLKKPSPARKEPHAKIIKNLRARREVAIRFTIRPPLTIMNRSSTRL